MYRVMKTKHIDKQDMVKVVLLLSLVAGISLLSLGCSASQEDLSFMSFVATSKANLDLKLTDFELKPSGKPLGELVEVRTFTFRLPKDAVFVSKQIDEWKPSEREYDPLLKESGVVEFKLGESRFLLGVGLASEKPFPPVRDPKERQELRSAFPTDYDLAKAAMNSFPDGSYAFQYSRRERMMLWTKYLIIGQAKEIKSIRTPAHKGFLVVFDLKHALRVWLFTHTGEFAGTFELASDYYLVENRPPLKIDEEWVRDFFASFRVED